MSVRPSKRAVARHVEALSACRRCPRMHRPVVVGEPVPSRVLLVGQAPGVKEPQLRRPFAWTAGKTLFKWFERSCRIDEATFRRSIYMAAVCRCFPGKNPNGGDRVPSAEEIDNCAPWLDAEIELLRPELVLPVGKLAISRFVSFGTLREVVGTTRRAERSGHAFDVIALPHPSGASTWHRTEPGRGLLEDALEAIARHPALRAPLDRAISRSASSRR